MESAPIDKLLLVEDEILIRRVFGRLLKNEPYDVLYAATVTEGMTTFTREGPIAVAIIDAHVGADDGVALARSFQVAQPSVHIILCSGGLDGPTGMKDGSYHRLNKPFDTEELRSLLAKTRRGTVQR